jgi:anti-anti-sigma factor
LLLDRLLEDPLEETMQDAHPLSLPSEPRTQMVVVRLAGEFDSFAERLFMTCVEQLLSGEYPGIVFDFGRVQFTDASGIRCMLQAQRRFRVAGKSMALVGLPPAIERILMLVGLRHAFTIYEDLEAAGLHLVETRVKEHEAA